MFKINMYVRCPADIESVTDPRVFVCGQITAISEFQNTLTVSIHDPFKDLVFFEELPRGTLVVPIDSAERCRLFIGSEVVYKDEQCKVLADQKREDGYYDYYLQSEKDKHVIHVCERDVVAPFNNGDIDPSRQLLKYEFQNPCWYMGHSVVSRSMNILDNSMYGFRELAGSKIYLLPHQVNTIMRCLQESPCRYMLADEVGMGKTIEAISVLKIFMQSHCNTNILIVVPSMLKEQWKTELLLKFNIVIGNGKDNNRISIKTVPELTRADLMMQWDFVVVDEVHRYLEDQEAYAALHCISRLCQNVLLLSATPVQKKRSEYLKLLRLLAPKKYDNYSEEAFGTLIEKQGKIVQKTVLILDDLEDYEEEIKAARDEDEDPHESEDCEDLFEEIHGYLEDICEELNDPRLEQMLEDIQYDDEDLAIYHMRVIISYICANYQIESHVIRNRRKILEGDDENERLLPSRQLLPVKYALDPDKNFFEMQCYGLITEWLNRNKGQISIQNVVFPLLGSFFSSSWAFLAELEKLQKNGIKIEQELYECTENWNHSERRILDDLNNVLEDPDSYEDEYSNRMVIIMNLLYEELYDQKIVLFTDFSETFDAYKKALQTVFDADEISFFGGDMAADEIEMNAYRFQNEKSCRIMLCDYTGGEGRNFQCADYVVHIDMPLDANMIEQRIGRLDRLERDRARPVVYSVVVYTEETFEEALFKFWNEGLKIFTQSLSGMEIIMKDVNDEIMAALSGDFEYGLFDRINHIIEAAETMREEVRKEQNYDAASIVYRPMYIELRRLIDYYAQNENKLFETTMRNWASLAGFHGRANTDGIVVYSESSFSPKSAMNSQLIPPFWKDYLLVEQNKFVNDVEAAYSKAKSITMESRSIKGTFIRKKAIENDYLHFFAPGDAIFDCIVKNSMNSTKGKCSAFTVLGNINWRGLIFTWSLVPDEAYLLDHGISIYALGPYRNYLMTEQLVIPYSINNPGDYSDERILKEYNQLINAGFDKKRTVHLGKRTRQAQYLQKIITQQSNLDWFKKTYPEERWEEIVNTARESAYERAVAQFKRKSNIHGASEEMERTLSARVANSEYFGLNDDKIEAIKQEQEYILTALKNPKIILDSAAYIWMVEYTHESTKN